jgi:hypothetical protein
MPRAQRILSTEVDGDKNVTFWFTPDLGGCTSLAPQCDPRNYQIGPVKRRPPCRQVSLRPRSIASGESLPRLRLKAWP